MRHESPWLQMDNAVLAACLALFAIGVTVIYSISLAQDGAWVYKQLLSGIIAVAAAAAMLKISLSSIRRYVILIMAATILMMCLPFLFEPRNGAYRWVSIGIWSLQPAEFFKWTALLIVAYYASRPHYQRRQVAFVLPVIAWLIVPLTLVILQRDFGTLILVFMMALVVLFLAGLDLRLVTPLLILFLIVAALLIFSEPYRVQRFMSFSDPFVNDGGYHQRHALIAFFLGGIWGSGVERSIQKWGYLPEPHNDFIIAIIGEEMGLVGVFAVCILLAFIVGRAIRIGNAAQSRGDVFGALYALGFASLLTLQSFINIGGNLSLLPFKGFTLPLVSYGGSSLLTMGLMLGVLMRIDWENRQEGAIPLRKIL